MSSKKRKAKADVPANSAHGPVEAPPGNLFVMHEDMLEGHFMFLENSTSYRSILDMFMVGHVGCQRLAGLAGLLLLVCMHSLGGNLLGGG